MKTKQVGSILVHRVAEFESMPVEATSLFHTCTSEMLARGRTWLDERFIARDADQIFISMHSFVIQSGGQNILVDCCLGNDKQRGGDQAYYNGLHTDYLDKIAALGLRPEDIDCVLCTHLHFDHVGWNTRLDNGRWVPTFPNARYLMGRADYDHFLTVTEDSPDAMHLYSFNDSVLPVVEAGLAEFVDPNLAGEHDLGPGLQLGSAAGHTPGSILLRARSGDRSAIFTGDVWHHPIQIGEPSLAIFVDQDPVQAAATKHRLIEECADTDTLVKAAHFPSPTAGRIVSQGEDLRFRFAED